MDDLDTNPGLVALFERLSRYGAYLVAMLGVVVLIGWTLDIAAFKSLSPGWETMKANTALGFMLGGLTLALGCRPPHARGWQTTRMALATAVVIIGLLPLAGHIFAADLAVGWWLGPDSGSAGFGSRSGGMPPGAALGFVLTGLALLSLDGRRSFLIGQFAALSSGSIGILAILGYAYGVAALYGIGAYASVAFHTALGFVIINMAILLSRPRHGFSAILTSNTAGGMMARRLLPIAFIAPFAIGWGLVVSEELGLIKARFGVALGTLLNLAVFSTVLWRTAKLIHHSDQVRLVAQNAQRKQQAQLAGIIDSAMDGIIMADAEQRISLFNPAAEKMFGRSAASVLGRPLDILIPARYREEHAEHFRAFSTTAASHRRMGRLGTIVGLRASGEEFPIEASISRLQADGIRLSTVILRDISDRRRFEEALLESRRQLTAIIDQAPISIALFDREMRYLAASSQWVAEHGGGSGDLRGKCHYDVVPDTSDYWRQVHRDGLAGTSTQNDSDLWIKPDGSRQWLRWAVRPWIDQDGKIGGIIVSTEDITRYKQIELALRASEDDLNRAQAVGNIGSWRLDVKNNELTWSSENYRIFGIPEGVPQTYESFLERVHPDDRGLVDRLWHQALAAPGMPYDLEHRILVNDGVKWVREKAELEFDSNGALAGGFGITQDITARRRAEEQIKAANDRLGAVAAERAASLRELSSALTNAEQRERDRLYELLHDHVQPLLVASRLALSGLGPQSTREDMLRVVAQSKEQISSVIQTARTLSVELNPPLIRNRGLIPALESLCRWVQENYRVTVNLECAEATEPGNLTIRLLCFKGVRELLMNVVKYARTDHAEIKLACRDREMLLITVKDEGQGFDPATGPVGSGLANIEQRLGMVGGSLSIESAPGRGCSVTLLVPLELQPTDQPLPFGGGLAASWRCRNVMATE